MAGLGDQPPSRAGNEPQARPRRDTASRARPLSISSTWDAYREKRRSRAGSPDATHSRWLSGFDDDYSAYLQQNDFELEQDTRQFHFDEDSDVEGGESDREVDERLAQAAENRKSYVENRKSYVGDRKSYIGDRKSYVGDRKSYVGSRKSYISLPGDRAGENAALETASSIVPITRRRTTKSMRSEHRDPNMVSATEKSWLARHCLTALRRDMARLLATVVEVWHLLT